MNRQKLLPLMFATAALAAGAAQSATWGYGQTSGVCSTGTSTSTTSTANLTGTASATSVNTSGSCVSSASGTGAGTAGGAKLSGWSNTGSGGAWSAASLSDHGAANGYGVINRSFSGSGDNESSGTGGHAIDNSVNIDGMLFAFDKSTILQQLTIGWSGSDSDLSVLYYTGGATTASAAMSGWGSGAVGSGWNLLKQYDVRGGISSPDEVVNLANTGNKSSSFWLITAYNSAFGGGSVSAGADTFKLLSVAGTTAGRVSEPGALALAGLALFGAVAVRRQRRKNA